jgi:hypothetical protein
LYTYLSYFSEQSCDIGIVIHSPQRKKLRLRIYANCPRSLSLFRSICIFFQSFYFIQEGKTPQKQLEVTRQVAQLTSFWSCDNGSCVWSYRSPILQE